MTVNQEKWECVRGKSTIVDRVTFVIQEVEDVAGNQIMFLLSGLHSQILKTLFFTRFPFKKWINFMTDTCMSLFKFISFRNKHIVGGIVFYKQGPKLTMSLVNDSLKFTSSDTQIR